MCIRDRPEILDRTDKVEFAFYSFKVNGKEVTNDTLKDLKIYKITASVTNSTGNTAEEAYTGYRLSDVLAAAGAVSYTHLDVYKRQTYYRGKLIQITIRAGAPNGNQGAAALGLGGNAQASRTGKDGPVVLAGLWCRFFYWREGK